MRAINDMRSLKLMFNVMQTINKLKWVPLGHDIARELRWKIDRRPAGMPLWELRRELREWTES